MARMVDAEEAYKVLTDYYHHKTEIQHDALKEAIERVPTVDIDAITESHERDGYDRGFRDGYAQATSEVKHGHWIDGNGNPVSWDDMNIGCPSDSCYCSECGDWLTASDEYPAKGYYCPNCGARMEV